MDIAELRQYLETAIADAAVNFDAANSKQDVVGIAGVVGGLSGAMRVAVLELGWMERSNEKEKTNG